LTAAKFALRSTPALLLLGLALLMLPPTHPLLPSVQGSSVTIHLVGYYTTGWNGSNPRITVTQGDTVTIDVSSGDGIQHGLLIDFDGDTLSDTADCSPTADPCTIQSANLQTVTFTANNVGSYKYYCTVHPSMVGDFVVQAPPTPNFSIVSNPTSLSIMQGSTGTATITLSSLDGFSGTLNLTGTVSPSGPIVSFSPSSMAILSGGTATSTLTVSSAGGLYSSVTDGNYSVSITASNGTLSHQTTVQVIVGSSNSSPSGAPNLPLAVLGGAAVILTAVAGITVYLVKKRKPAK